MANHMGRAKRICYLSPMRAAKVQASLRIRAVSPEPSLLAHTNSESRGTFRQKARSLAPLNGWACAVKICHDGMLEDTNSLDGAHMVIEWIQYMLTVRLVSPTFDLKKKKKKMKRKKRIQDYESISYIIRVSRNYPINISYHCNGQSIRAAYEFGFLHYTTHAADKWSSSTSLCLQHIIWYLCGQSLLSSP